MEGAAPSTAAATDRSWFDCCTSTDSRSDDTPVYYSSRGALSGGTTDAVAVADAGAATAKSAKPGLAAKAPAAKKPTRLSPMDALR